MSVIPTYMFLRVLFTHSDKIYVFMRDSSEKRHQDFFRATFQLGQSVLLRFDLWISGVHVASERHVIGILHLNFTFTLFA